MGLKRLQDWARDTITLSREEAQEIVDALETSLDAEQASAKMVALLQREFKDTISTKREELLHGHLMALVQACVRLHNSTKATNDLGVFIAPSMWLAFIDALNTAKASL